MFLRRAAPVAFLCILAGCGRAEAPREGVAAMVDGRPIPRRLVEALLRSKREARSLDPATPAGREALARQRGEITDDLVEGLLIAAEVERRGLVPTAAQIDAAERRAVDSQGGEEGYRRFLSDSGFTREEYREWVLAAALRMAALTGALTQGETASDEDVKLFFEAHPTIDDFQWPERVTGAHIQVNAKPDVILSQLEVARPALRRGTPEMKAAVDAEMARKRQIAEELRAQALRPGADFAALAAKHSEDPATRDAGGSLGTFPMGTHARGLDEAFFATAPGDIGPLVETDAGFHVIRTVARLPAEPRTLAEAAPFVREMLLNDQKGRRLNAFVRNTRRTSKVEVFPWDGAPKAGG